MHKLFVLALLKMTSHLCIAELEYLKAALANSLKTFGLHAES